METNSQRQVFASVLEKLNEDVTKEDRELALKDLGLKSQGTISTYLTGKGTNNDVAAKLIKFFKQRIHERNKVLA